MDAQLMTGNFRSARAARAAVDRAHLAFVTGVLDGHWCLTIPCNGRLLLKPYVVCDHPAWKAIEAATMPDHAAVLALAEGWPAETRLHHAACVLWLVGVPARAALSGMWGKFSVELAGGNGRVTEAYQVIRETAARALAATDLAPSAAPPGAVHSTGQL